MCLNIKNIIFNSNKPTYFVREVEGVLHSLQSDTAAVREDGQEDRHEENIGMPFFREAILAQQSSIPHLKIHLFIYSF